MAHMLADKIPPVSREFVTALRNAFRGPRIKPGADRDQIMWDQAQAEVVDWVEKYARTHTVTGNPEALVRPEPPRPWWRKLFSRA